MGEVYLHRHNSIQDGAQPLAEMLSMQRQLSLETLIRPMTISGTFTRPYMSLRSPWPKKTTEACSEPLPAAEEEAIHHTECVECHQVKNVNEFATPYVCTECSMKVQRKEGQSDE
jgi:hypothetical protein